MGSARESRPVQDAGSRAAPLVSIGLPVYNGEDYLAEALDGLLSQTFADLELIISDNASTDGTAEICRAYAERDPRVRYVRQPVNVGAVANHNLLVPLARGRFFKWVGHDDLFEPDLIARCVAAFEEHPEAVLVNVWDGVVDPEGRLMPSDYPLQTASPEPHVRFRSLLRDDGGNDFYGMFRVETLRRVPPLASYLHSDRTYMAGLALFGPFHQVPELLYYRRDHPGRASRADTARRVVSTLDPRRASRWRHPVVRLYLEYVWGFVSAIRRSPLAWREKLLCVRELTAFLLTRMRLNIVSQVVTGRAPSARPPARRGSD